MRSTVKAISRTSGALGAQIVRFCTRECSPEQGASAPDPQAVVAAEPSIMPLLVAPRSRLRMGLAVGLGLFVLAPLVFRGVVNPPWQASPKLVAAASLRVPERPVSELISLTIGSLELVEPTMDILTEGTSWVHPVIDSESHLPSKRTRIFQAERAGERPDECGKGHCGIDLDGPRGTPVVAIRDGIIERVVRDENAKGGRYVWIRHEDIGLRTEYFHVDEIAPDIETGAPVQAGQWLGTLGKTGIEHSQPHLHFTVRDVGRDFLYLDPAQFLETARILELLDMRLASSD